MGRELKNDCRDRLLTDVAQVKYPARRWKNESELRMRKGRTNQPIIYSVRTARQLLSGAFHWCRE